MILSIYAICGAISILCNFSCFTMNILFAEIPYVWIALAPGCVCTVWGLIWSSGVFSRWRTKPFAESLTQYGKHPVSLIKQDTGDSYALSHWQSAVSNTAMLVTLSHSRTGPCRGLANDLYVCVSLSIWPTFSCHPFSDSNEAFPRDNALKHSRSEWKTRKGKCSVDHTRNTNKQKLSEDLHVLDDLSFSPIHDQPASLAVFPLLAQRQVCQCVPGSVAFPWLLPGLDRASSVLPWGPRPGFFGPMKTLG